MARTTAPSAPAKPEIVETVSMPYATAGGRSVAKVTANPLTEYVAGGAFTLSANFLRSLSFNIDDLSVDFGDDIYERMMLDAQVSSSVETLKGDILAQGVRLIPAMKKGDAGFDKAVRISDFCDLALASMDVSLTETLFDLLDAIPYGYRVAEIVSHIPQVGPLKGCLVPKYLKPKPRHACAFVVDAMNNLIGFLGMIPGQFSPLMIGSLIPDPSAPNFLPRSKFAVLTFRKRNGDPRGRSALRAAYFPWWMKQQGYPAWLKFMALFAVPGLIGNVAPKATPTMVTDALTGEPVYNLDGTPRMATPEEAMIAAMERFYNGSCMALPADAKVTPLQVSGQDAPFLPLNGWCDQQISIAITGQTLSSMEGEHMSRAAATVHQDTKGVTVQQGKEALQNMIRNDILKGIVGNNFGPDAILLTPFVSLAETEQHDFAEEAKAIGDLWQCGYLSPSQVTEMDARLGLPARSKSDMDRMTQEADAKTEAAVNPPAPPDPAVVTQIGDDKPDEKKQDAK